MRMNKRYSLTELKEYGDTRGNMCGVEENREVPFPIRRFFYDFHTSGTEPRGNHANLHSQFAFISLAGSCTVTVDDGEHRDTFLLDDPHKMLWVDKMTWKTMQDFSADNVLLVVSDQLYDSHEYIRDYAQFLSLCQQMT